MSDPASTVHATRTLGRSDSTSLTKITIRTDPLTTAAKTVRRLGAGSRTCVVIGTSVRFWNSGKSCSEIWPRSDSTNDTLVPAKVATPVTNLTCWRSARRICPVSSVPSGDSAATIEAVPASSTPTRCSTGSRSVQNNWLPASSRLLVANTLPFCPNAAACTLFTTLDTFWTCARTAIARICCAWTRCACTAPRRWRARGPGGDRRAGALRDAADLRLQPGKSLHDADHRRIRLRLQRAHLGG